MSGTHSTRQKIERGTPQARTTSSPVLRFEYGYDLQIVRSSILKWVNTQVWHDRARASLWIWLSVEFFLKWAVQIGLQPADFSRPTGAVVCGAKRALPFTHIHLRHPRIKLFGPTDFPAGRPICTRAAAANRVCTSPGILPPCLHAYPPIQPFQLPSFRAECLRFLRSSRRSSKALRTWLTVSDPPRRS